MYFKKLELVGFKSFMEKTTFNFEQGITAVVGPNGCGKSNIFDSIRWVLGEQSAKSLRGTQMEDVIFNGTDIKEPVSLGEVTLTFDNSQKVFCVDHDEVAITRRIFRSGESEYLLNKTQVRLKDIIDLLSGTGIGAEGYSLVEQGKIDIILSSRPEDRPLIFDEASGITKYKSQKKEATRKLEETEQNLLRVNDIITEVKRQIGSLERQANKARRYKEVFEELKTKEITLSLLEKKLLKNQENEILADINLLQQQQSQLLEVIKAEEAKISSRQQQLKDLEDKLMAVKNQILSLDNSVLRNNEHTRLNQERIVELDNTKNYLAAQIEQTKKRLILDEEKLNNVKNEYNNIRKNIDEKTASLKENEFQLTGLNVSIKVSHERILEAKRSILELASKSANTKNEIADLFSKQQIHLARQKRLELEKAKAQEEKSLAAENLDTITKELEGFRKDFKDLELKLSGLKRDAEAESNSLHNINTDLEDLEKQRLVLESQRVFLEELKTKYEDIGESMNAVIYLDKAPRQKLTGLVVKIRSQLKPDKGELGQNITANLKLQGEAKPINLDTQGISDQIKRIEAKISALKETRVTKEGRIQELHKLIQEQETNFRQQEVNITQKQTVRNGALEHFNKIKEEESIILIELDEVGKELSVLKEESKVIESQLLEVEKEQKNTEGIIAAEQNNIVLNSNLKENALVVITKLKTELEDFIRRIGSDEATLKILEDTYAQDKQGLLELEKQMSEASGKQDSLTQEIEGLKDQIKAAESAVSSQKEELVGLESRYRQISEGSSGVVEKLESDRSQLDKLKNKLHELEMQNKEVDFKITSIKERILQAYKVDLESLTAAEDATDRVEFTNEIQRLKEKLDSYGTVNLVAIEEYDELKKRYDFLTQQQNDLITAKESIHEAILKINRTTRKLFFETFEKIREEFRNYFKLLFNGGDAQLFLIDEQDPLESGIEIICRPGQKIAKRAFTFRRRKIAFGNSIALRHI